MQSHLQINQTIGSCHEKNNQKIESNWNYICYCVECMCVIAIVWWPHVFKIC